MKKSVEVQTVDEDVIEAHVTQWQELRKTDMVQQRQEQEIIYSVKKSGYSIVMEEKDHDFQNG
jgi:hypothetical protein